MTARIITNSTSKGDSLKLPTPRMKRSSFRASAVKANSPSRCKVEKRRCGLMSASS
ncbi:hypothetical protein D3C73_1022000 [compost metagenome]